jgi:hypothetical protein
MTGAVIAAAVGDAGTSGDVAFRIASAGAWSWSATFTGTVLFELTGPGGHGGQGSFDLKSGISSPGYGAGGGGKASKTVTVAAGDTFNGFVGEGGSGAATTCFSPAITAVAGANGGGGGGVGGSASGGDSNLTGRAGGLVNYWTGGGAASGGGDQLAQDSNGTAPGGGGSGYVFFGGAGADGEIKLTRLS